ncbi:ArsR family transcriptional regulator [Microbispora sp. H13382]|uniref:ArsR/SmtB family transcription factor n=1 Tax=Microbispora sp. H13382 TaxID=2729112 RepID=UPI001C71A8EC|nr:ArsR family transcriptional regulator [Microbispora sp. H13382]
MFHALAHDARRIMLPRLATGVLTVGKLAEPLRMSPVAASKHVKVLENAGPVQRTVVGRRHVCRQRPGLLASAGGWLRSHERFRDDRLGAPRQVLDRPPPPIEEAS